MNQSEQQTIQEATAHALVCLSQAVGQEPPGSLRWPLLAEALDALERIAAVAFGARDGFSGPLPAMHHGPAVLPSNLLAGPMIRSPAASSLAAALE